jgi:hypothetical protein
MGCINYECRREVQGCSRNFWSRRQTKFLYGKKIGDGEGIFEVSSSKTLTYMLEEFRNFVNFNK